MRSDTADITRRIEQLSPEKRAQLEKLLSQRKTTPAGTPITPRPADVPVPIAYNQAALWFFQKIDPNMTVYNVPFAFMLRGTICVEWLEESINAVIQRHEALRTRFPTDAEGNPIQVIEPKFTLPLPVEDVSDRVQEATQDALLQTLFKRENIPFDLANLPPIRAKLFRLSEQAHVLYINVHHIVFDGKSIDLLIHEIAQFYRSFAEGSAPAVPELPVQYPDITVWEHSPQQQAVIDAALEKIRPRYAGGMPLLEMPTDHPRPPVQTYGGHQRVFTIDLDKMEALQRRSREADVSLYVTMLSAFYVLLYRYTAQEHIVIGAPLMRRPSTSTENLIGYFINMLILQARLSGDLSFRDLVKQVRDDVADTMSGSTVPFTKLAEALQIRRNASYFSTFQAVFNFMTPEYPKDLFPGAELTFYDIDHDASHFDFDMLIRQYDDCLKCYLHWNTDLFDDDTMTRLIGHYCTLLDAIADNPDVCVRDLPILTEPEKQLLLVDWNRTSTDYPSNRPVHELFQEQARRTPDAVAVKWRGQVLTYAQLNQQANQLARYLRERQAEPGAAVGIVAERTPAMIVATLAIVKMGCCYVPLDLSYPAERLAFMIEDTGIDLILASTDVPEFLKTSVHSTLVDIDAALAASVQYSDDDLTIPIGADDLAYIMYTSGSTGTPKGIEVRHQGIVRLVKNTNYMEFTPDDVFLQLAPVSFDAATLEIWGALLNGSRVVLYPDPKVSVDGLATALQDEGVTVLWLTAGLFRLMVESRPEALTGLRYLLAGGDVLPVEHVNKINLMLGPDRYVINGYGPTENTTFTCCYVVPKGGELQRTVPIGRPIANTTVYILDAYLNPVPIGVVGELYTGGHGLARGYRNRPEQTAERFVNNPFVAGDRLYRTGDLVKYRADGNILFIGRADHQVKVSGYRIELGEIEETLAKHEAVTNAVVVALTLPSGDKQLVGYVVSPESVSSEALRDYLAQQLPSYMIPAIIMQVEALPLTDNGKVNRAALPKPQRQQSQEHSARPGTPHEAEIAQMVGKLLGIDRIGIHDNFFDELGGTSLLAARLMAQIEMRFGVRVPLAEMFKTPTVAYLASLIESGKTNWSSLVPLRPEGEKTPLFLVHGVRGNLLNYRQLVQQIDAAYPVYGLQAAGLNGMDTPHDSVCAMAAAYIKDIQSVQPHGPYTLFGHSFGGMVAFEMAQQLRAQGETVHFLGLLDTRLGMDARLSRESFAAYVEFQYHRFRFHLESLMQQPAKFEYLRARLHTIRRRLRSSFWRISHTNRKGVVSRKINQPTPQDVAEYCFLAARQYRPQPYPGNACLFRANIRSVELTDGLARWQALALGGLEVVTIPGNHTDMLAMPNVIELGKAINERLGRLG